MKLKLIGLLLLPSLSAHAAVVTWDNGGADSSWETPENWSDDAAPSAGNDYVIGSGQTVQNPTPPASNQSYTFGGDSLRVESGGVLVAYRFNQGATYTLTLTIPNLTIAGGTLRTHVGFATNHVTLTSGIAFEGGGTIQLNPSHGSFSHNFNLNGAITGDGLVTIQRNTQGTGRAIIFNGDVSNFTGDWSLTGGALDGTTSDTLNVTFTVGSGGWGSGDLTAAAYTNLTVNAAFTSPAGILTLLDTTGTTLNLGADFTIGGLNINGNIVPNDTYTAADLTALGFGGTFNGAGSLTIVPEPAAALLGSLGLLGLLRRRRS